MFNFDAHEMIAGGAIAFTLVLVFIWWLIGLYGVKYNQYTQKDKVIANSEAELERFLAEGGEPTEYTQCCMNNLKKFKPDSAALKNAEYHIINS